MRPQIDAPDRTLFVKSGYPNTRPYYTTRALAIRDAVSGDLIVNWSDTATYTPKAGVRVIDMSEMSAGGVQRIIGTGSFLDPGVTGTPVWTEEYSDYATPLAGSRDGAGIYTMLLTGGFTGTVIPQYFQFASMLTHVPTPIGTITIGRINNNVIDILTYNTAGVLADVTAGAGMHICITHILPL